MKRKERMKQVNEWRKTGKENEGTNHKWNKMKEKMMEKIPENKMKEKENLKYKKRTREE